MPSSLTGLHHVTALAKSPRENLDFYTRVLGLRLIKRTVNYDDPLTYHLYYGDEAGSPGTLLTHFPQPHAKRGRHGAPEIRETVLRTSLRSLQTWRERLGARGVDVSEEESFGRTRLVFDDPHGMRLALVEGEGGDGDGIEAVDAVAVHLSRRVDEAQRFLSDALGFRDVGRDGGRRRLAVGNEDAGALELVETAGVGRGEMGAGTVHHVAWRTPDEAAQRDVAERVRSAGVEVTPMIDRQYFRSIYFRIPAGVIFEVATDGPGFEVDESREALGSSLVLPPQHEPRRAEIEAHLAPLD